MCMKDRQPCTTPARNNYWNAWRNWGQNPEPWRNLPAADGALCGQPQSSWFINSILGKSDFILVISLIIYLQLHELAWFLGYRPFWVSVLSDINELIKKHGSIGTQRQLYNKEKFILKVARPVWENCDSGYCSFKYIWHAHVGERYCMCSVLLPVSCGLAKSFFALVLIDTESLYSLYVLTGQSLALALSGMTLILTLALGFRSC